MPTVYHLYAYCLHQNFELEIHEIAEYYIRLGRTVKPTCAFGFKGVSWIKLASCLWTKVFSCRRHNTALQIYWVYDVKNAKK